MRIVRCHACRLPFVAAESWERQCFPCWKKQKDYKLTKADVALQRTSAALGPILAELEELKAKKKNTALSSTVIKEDGAPPIKQLLLLCHPDKHGNSKAATEVTQWLLSVRRKTK